MPKNTGTKSVHGKHKAHTIYKNAAGVRIPGVTTITGMLGWNSRTLINWANRMGLQGIDTNKYVDDKAAIGTLAHLFVTDGIQDVKTDTSDYSQSQISEAMDSVQNFYRWKDEHDFNPIFVERRLISELYQYGGQIDIYAKIDEKFWLVDLKTGSGVYPEMMIQVAGAYANALRENGYAVDGVRILNIPRSKTEGFIDRAISPEMSRACFKVFQHCRKIYDLKKEIK